MRPGDLVQLRDDMGVTFVWVLEAIDFTKNYRENLDGTWHFKVVPGETSMIIAVVDIPESTMLFIMDWMGRLGWIPKNDMRLVQ